MLHKTEIDAFISPRWIITVRKDDGFSMEPVLEPLGSLELISPSTASASCCTGCST